MAVDDVAGERERDESDDHMDKDSGGENDQAGDPGDKGVNLVREMFGSGFSPLLRAHSLPSTARLCNIVLGRFGSRRRNRPYRGSCDAEQGDWSA